jgi:4a-hydroxytetrahydrobiopterin dehydratase
MAVLEPDELRAALDDLAGWEADGDAIVRNFELDGFPEAIALIVRIGFAAEALDHHPELSNSYSRVTVRLTSHDAGGVTERDLRLAQRIDQIAGSV